MSGSGSEPAPERHMYIRLSHTALQPSPTSTPHFVFVGGGVVAGKPVAWVNSGQTREDFGALAKMPLVGTPCPSSCSM
jgi:hypothetical protein